MGDFFVGGGEILFQLGTFTQMPPKKSTFWIPEKFKAYI